MRGPLQAVTLSLEILSDSLRGEELRHDALDRRDCAQLEHAAQQVGAMRSQTVRLQTLLENLLFAARVGEGRLTLARQPVMLGALIEEVHTVVSPVLAQRAQVLHVVVPADLPPISADARRLAQALISVLLVIAQSSPPATGIDVQAVVPVGSRRTEPATRRRDPPETHTCTVRVTAAGSGPERDEVARFCRGDSAGQPSAGGSSLRSAAAPVALATALGLAVASAILHAHGGRLVVRPGAGSSAAVWCELQASPPAAASHARRQGASCAPLRAYGAPMPSAP
jgi:K+-sensing histidine kinase KdpD